jgi:hypothetical protein
MKSSKNGNSDFSKEEWGFPILLVRFRILLDSHFYCDIYFAIGESNTLLNLLFVILLIKKNMNNQLIHVLYSFCLIIYGQH